MSLVKCKTRTKENIINYEKEKFLQTKTEQDKINYIARVYRVLDQLKDDYYNFDENNDVSLVKKKYLKELINKYQATIDEIKYVRKKEYKEKINNSLEKLIENDENYTNYKKKIKFYITTYKNKMDNEKDFIQKKAYERLYNIYKNFVR